MNSILTADGKFFDYTIPPDLRNDQQVYLCPHYMHFRQTEIERERERKRESGRKRKEEGGGER